MKTENQISNKRLAQIADEAAKKIPELIAERETEILADYHSAVQDAQDDGEEKTPKLKLGLKLSYDLKASELEVKLSWTVSRKSSETMHLDDPEQSKLNLE